MRTSGRTERANDLKRVGKSAVETVLDRVGRGVGKVQERTPLPYDVLESSDAFLVVFDAPGATRSDIQVRFRDGAVEVRIDRFRDFREGFEMRFPGRGLALDGRADLPEGAAVDPAGAEATLTDNGTLQVTLPKTEDARTTTVAVTDESESETGDEVTTTVSSETSEGVEESAGETEAGSSEGAGPAGDEGGEDDEE